MIKKSKAKKDYFLLLKINIPFFNENEFAPYSDCFELMDIPGLSTNSNFYINELFPYFINNAKFCIFLFDAVEYDNGDTEFIFNVISEKFENKENIFNNSIFILNKIDKVDKESEVQNFEDYMENKFKIKNIKVFCCNSKLLLFNHFKSKSFLNYLEYIFSKPKDENNDDTNKFIIDNMKQHFKIEPYSNEINTYNEEEKKEFDEYLNNENISIENYNKLEVTEINKYFYYKRKFDENKNEIKDDEEIKQINLDLKKKFFNSIKNVFDNINFEKLIDLKNEIENKCFVKEIKINEENPFKNNNSEIILNSKTNGAINR